MGIIHNIRMQELIKQIFDWRIFIECIVMAVMHVLLHRAIFRLSAWLIFLWLCTEEMFGDKINKRSFNPLM